jgi:hypothetical protein
MIDMASVYAERYKKTPDVLRAAVVGQSPDSRLDPYTALNALKLVNESNRMMMASQAQQPTSSPSLVAQNMAPPPMQQGLGAMVPGTMDQSPQGMPPQQAPMPQPTMQAASGGLAGMYTPEEDFAEGGIVAFAAPTPENNYSLVKTKYGDSNRFSPFANNTKGESEGEEDDYLARLDEIEGGEGSPAGLAAANKLTLATARRIASRDLRDLTPEERKTMYAEEYKRITDAAGPSPYAGMRTDLAEQGKERAGALNLAQGEALLQAASDVLEGNNAIRGLAKGGAKFAKVYGEAQRADKLAKRSMAQMEFHIADAERKERMGNSRAASAAVESARKDRKDMNKAELDRDIALGNLSSEMGKINKPPRAAGGAQPSAFNVLFNAKQELAKDPTNPLLQAAVKNAEQSAALTKTSYSTGEIGEVNAATRLAPTLRAIDADVVAKLGEFKDGDRAYRAAIRKKDTTEANRLLTLEEARLRAAYQTPAAAPAKSTAAPTAAPKPTAAPTAAPKPTTATKVVSMADVNATVASSGRTKQEVMDALKANGYTVK